MSANLASNQASNLAPKKFQLPPPGSHIHMMGICGTAMGALAGLLHDRGYRITGSDQNIYPPMSLELQKLKIPIREGYRKENLTPRPDFVIVGNVISKHFEEAQELLNSNIPFCSLPAALGNFVIEDRHSMVVAGTHGKTTTTAMLSWVAECCGFEPGFLIGGVPKNFPHSYRNPKSDLFVIEGDEYDTAFFDKVPKFIHYRPRTAILTSIEFDHADIYKDIHAVEAAFRRLLEILPSASDSKDGLLVACNDNLRIREMIGQAGAPEPFSKNRDQQGAQDAATTARIVTYGLTPHAQYRPRLIKQSPDGTEFEVFWGAKRIARVQWSLIGQYNISNALAVMAVARERGWPLDRVAEALSSFQGVKRRQEIIGRPGGVIVMEDFAHHPTAVRETLHAVRERYPSARLFAVFEPRSATSRRQVFQKDYVEAFAGADEVLLPPVFHSDQLAESDRFSVEVLAQDLHVQYGISAEVISDVDEIVARLVTRAKKNDVILIMSNGGFGGIYQKLLQQLDSKKW